MAEIVARARVGSGAGVERLMCHLRLPLIAGWDGERPAVHIWDSAAGELHYAGTVGPGSADYADAVGWARAQRTPAAAWHPDQALLVVAGEGNVAEWTPGGVRELAGVPPRAAYRSLAFSPDGRTLWASPGSGGEGNSWESSDALDLASGTVATGRGWDTGVAMHPAGGLVATLRSDQGATLLLFAQVGQQRTPAAMRVLGRALILDADGYQAPLFSADGRYLAIRGDAYEQSLTVFEFPSLHRVLATILGEPNPGYPYPQQWLDQMRAWSKHNITFGPQPGVLWAGTPAGTLAEIDLNNHHVTGHEILAGSPVTALAATAASQLAAATGAGDLVLVSTPANHTTAHTADASMLQAMVTAFLGTTFEVPDDGELAEHLVLTDGDRAWGPDDLATVTTAATTDPGWLQIQAAINSTRDQQQ